MMRYLKLSTLLALPMAFALTLGAAPQPAEAGLCTQLGKSNGCVNNKDVANNKLKANDMKDEGGANFNNSDNTSFTLTGTAQTAKSVTITAPRPGVVIVNASGYFGVEGAAAATGRCAITTLTTDDLFNSFFISVAADEQFIPFGATRGFDVAAGAISFNLVCLESVGNLTVRRAVLTAIYVPTKY